MRGARRAATVRFACASMRRRSRSRIACSACNGNHSRRTSAISCCDAAYQLAVVVDDAAQGVTDVVRGADLLASTPRQIFLQQLLGLPSPRYLHVPVAADIHGRKLSKATGAAALPDAAVPALLAAWRFLEQPGPDETPDSVADFWRFALDHWRVAALPRVAMRAAPRV